MADKLTAAYMVFADQMELLPYDENVIPKPDKPDHITVRSGYLGEAIGFIPIPQLQKHLFIESHNNWIVYYDPNGIPENQHDEIAHRVLNLLDFKAG